MEAIAIIVVAAVSGLWALLTFVRSNAREAGQSEAQSKSVIAAIDRLTAEIKSIADDIRQHVRDDDKRFSKIDGTISEHGERITRVEEASGVGSIPRTRVVEESGPIR